MTNHQPHIEFDYEIVQSHAFIRNFQNLKSFLGVALTVLQAKVASSILLAIIRKQISMDDWLNVRPNHEVR